MVYCSKCGTDNEDDARFCRKCGHDLLPHLGAAAPQPPPDRPKDWDDNCDRTCYGTPHGKSMFWGIIIVIVGMFIIWEFAVKNVVDLPGWLEDFEFCWVAWIIVGIAIVIAGIRAVTWSNRQR
jgi:hypothetical protein